MRTDSQYSEQLAILRDRLSAADGSVLVGFTGTPLLAGPADGRRLLDIIKGRPFLHASDEGFLSSLSCKPTSLFPLCVPEGVDRADLRSAKKLCCRIILRGEALQSYVLRSNMELSRRRLQAYCNLHVFSGSYHGGRHGCQEFVLKHPQHCAPKFWNIAQSIGKTRQKTLVLISRGTGYRAAVDTLRQEASRAELPFQVACIDNLAEFNSPENLRGELFLCMVADSKQCGEGVSFRTVRQLFLLDVPSTPTALVQICGRASRMLGHQALPDQDRVVRVQIFIATVPDWARQPLGRWSSIAMARKGQSGRKFERRAQGLFAELLDKVGDLRKLKAKLMGICKKKASMLQNSSRNIEEQIGVVYINHRLERAPAVEESRQEAQSRTRTPSCRRSHIHGCFSTRATWLDGGIAHHTQASQSAAQACHSSGRLRRKTWKRSCGRLGVLRTRCHCQGSVVEQWSFASEWLSAVEQCYNLCQEHRLGSGSELCKATADFMISLCAPSVLKGTVCLSFLAGVELAVPVRDAA